MEFKREKVGNRPHRGQDSRGDLPFHWWLAQNFALCDNYYCSHMGVTDRCALPQHKLLAA
ncbi:MAG TPA: alkaline phosphatase family protein [Terriglobia bacterium]|nr:alkaline phosphatase family protein [Terriglobia bacterium]